MPATIIKYCYKIKHQEDGGAILQVNNVSEVSEEPYAIAEEEVFPDENESSTSNNHDEFLTPRVEDSDNELGETEEKIEEEDRYKIGISL